MKCQFWNRCTFYANHISKMPVTASVYKRTYCDLDFVKCARNMVAAELGHELVPNDLFPTHNVRARKIVGEKSQTAGPHTAEKAMHHEEVAAQLLKRFNGDYVVALGEFYAEVRRKYPGYVCSIEPKPDDEFYYAHQEYICIRDQIHSLVKK